MESSSKEPGRPSLTGRDALAALLVLMVVGGLALAHFERLRRPEPKTREPARWVDPGQALVTASPAWVDPRWLEHLDRILCALEPFEVEDRALLEPLECALGCLSFVERVERCELTSAGGLRLDLVLRRPVACIPVQGEFALVDREAVVLEGRWPVPPRLGAAILPVLGLPDDGLLDAARPGDWLVEPEHTDALEVALSMAEHLDEDLRAALGRVRIDARTARRASVEEPGVRLELEGGRLAFFGRSPECGEPGELPVASKWRSLTRAFELYARDPLASDWDLVDLRWDRPDLALRVAPEVAALTELGSNMRRAEARRGRAEPDPSRPEVR